MLIVFRVSFGLYSMKVWLTPNMIFGNIWVILRRNVMYLYSKKPHLAQRFHCQCFWMWCYFWYKEQRKLICNSPNDIISGNFDGEKVDQDGIFYYKEWYITFLLRMTQILHIQRIIFGVRNTLTFFYNIFCLWKHHVNLFNTAKLSMRKPISSSVLTIWNK
jgi:hypothetical protein